MVSIQKDNADSGQEYSGIYSPETLRKFADTGLNVSPADVRELKDVMDATAGQALYAGGIYGDVMTDLVGAVKRDEATYVEKKSTDYQAFLGEKLPGEPSLIEEKIAEAGQIKDAYVWHYAQEEGGFNTEVFWAAKEFSLFLDKAELYPLLQIVKKLNNDISIQGAYLKDLIQILHEKFSKQNFKRLLEVLEKQPREINLSEIYLIAELADDTAKNFDLVEAIINTKIDRNKLWMLKGKDFFKGSPSNFNRFFAMFDKDHREFDAACDWMPVCEGDIEKLQNVLHTLKKLKKYGIDQSDQVRLLETLKKKPDAYERFMRSVEIYEAFEGELGIYTLEYILGRDAPELKVLCGYLIEQNRYPERDRIAFRRVFRWLSQYSGTIDANFMETYLARLDAAKDILATIDVEAERWGVDLMADLVINRLMYFPVSQLNLLCENFAESMPSTQSLSDYLLNRKNFLSVDLLWELEKEDLQKIVEALQKVPQEKFNALIHVLQRFDKVYKKDTNLLVQTIEILARQPSSAITYGSGYSEFTSLYGDNIQKMEELMGVLSQAPHENFPNDILDILLDLTALYEGSIERLRATLMILNEKCSYQSANSKRRAMQDLKDVYGKDIQKMGEVLDVLNEAGDDKFTTRLISLKSVYGLDVKNMKEVLTILKEIPEEEQPEISESILILKSFYGNDMDKLRAVKNLLLKLKKEDGNLSLKELCEKAVSLSEEIGQDLRKLELLGKYLGVSDVIDKKVLAKYMTLYETEGVEAANNYIASLRKQAKGLVGSVIPEEQRRLEEYGYLLRYVYPKGNYSDHEKNLACGDKLEHLEGYQFDPKGYPVTLSGLNGYGLKEGKKEDKALLGGYMTRLQRMRDFVSHRGPDNKVLQEAYNKKIDGIFKEAALSDFKAIENLSVKEKLFCLIVSEAVRKATHEKLTPDEKFKPNEALLDLVVEYKYAFHENLEDYVQRSASDVQSYGDAVSQNYLHWNELSVIYGENMKHVMRNDILGAIASESNYTKIVEAYFKNLTDLSPDEDATNKVRERCNATLTNDRIDVSRKPDVLWKQIWTAFSNNLKFPNEEQKLAFEQSIKEAFGPVRENLSLEKLNEVLPQMLALRTERRFAVHAKVEDLLSRDINIIFAELAKYEELAEVEAKETTMGGPKSKEVKKSTKKRNIRGYFTKTQESANARMGAYLCISGDTRMWENPNYIEMVMQDEETNRCVGVTMLLNINAVDGKKYLWFGPNPFESFLTQVSAKKCYEYMYKAACNFAKENGYDGVVVPSNENSILGACTNRGGEFPALIKASRLKDKNGNIKVVKFGAKHALGGSYGYEDGALIWERETPSATPLAA